MSPTIPSARAVLRRAIALGVNFIDTAWFYGNEEEVGEGLNRAAGFLRGEVGRALALRHAPKLEFVYDQQIEHADKLTQLIDRAVKSDENKH